MNKDVTCRTHYQVRVYVSDKTSPAESRWWDKGPEHASLELARKWGEDKSTNLGFLGAWRVFKIETITRTTEEWVY